MTRVPGVLAWGAALALTVLAGLPADAQRTHPSFRVLSWNVSGRQPVERLTDFRGHLALAQPDVVVLDEVEGSVQPQPLRDAFPPPSDGQAPWQVLWGERGGRQRVVIAARMPVQPIALAQQNAYAPDVVEAVLAEVPPAGRDRVRADLATGLAFNAGLVRVARRRLLVAGVDLQCCGARWHDVRRIAESRMVRALLTQAIRDTRPDGVILVGDFNLASPPPAMPGTGALPLVLLSGPYPEPVRALLAAEAWHLGRREAWTINGGPQSPFPFLPFDFQLYSPHSLRQVEGLVLDTADQPVEALARAGLTSGASAAFSEHRAVIATYAWQ